MGRRSVNDLAGDVGGQQLPFLQSAISHDQSLDGNKGDQPGDENSQPGGANTEQGGAKIHDFPLRDGDGFDLISGTNIVADRADLRHVECKENHSVNV